MSSGWATTARPTSQSSGNGASACTSESVMPAPCHIRAGPVSGAAPRPAPWRWSRERGPNLLDPRVDEPVERVADLVDVQVIDAGVDGGAGDVDEWAEVGPTRDRIGDLFPRHRFDGRLEVGDRPQVLRQR